MTYSFFHGGIEAFLINLIKNLDYSEIQLDLLCLDEFNNDNAKKVFEEKGVKLITQNKKSNRKTIANDFNLYLKENKYDVIHIHTSHISLFLSLSIIAKAHHVHKVMIHSHSVGTGGINHYLGKLISCFLLPFTVDEYLACSIEAGKRKFSKYIVRNKLEVIKNGIDLDIYKVDNNKRIEYRNKLGISDDEILIGHVGRFSNEKNHKYIIELFSELKNRSDKYKLLLVGDGELTDEIKQKAVDKGIYNSITFAGIVDNVQDYMQAMDVFILPSIYEGLGIVNIEAQACGIPVIVSTGVPEEAKITDNFKFISLDDKQKWIDTIELFSTLPRTNNTEEIRVAGYDIKSTAQIVKDIYIH